MADLLATAFANLAARIKDLEQRQEVVATNTQLFHGGFEKWTLGVGPFSANNAFTADSWQIKLTGAGTLVVHKDSTNEDTTASLACAFCISGNTDAVWLQQTVTGPFVGTTLSLSVRVKTSTPNAVRVSINGVDFSDYHTGGGTYETLVVVSVPSSAPITAQIVFNAACSAFIDNAMLVQGAAPVDYTYYPLMDDA